MSPLTSSARFDNTASHGKVDDSAKAHSPTTEENRIEGKRRILRLTVAGGNSRLVAVMRHCVFRKAAAVLDDIIAAGFAYGGAAPDRPRRSSV
jgi:hypothetical protein